MSESTEKLGKKVKIGGIRVKDRNQQKSQAKKVRIGGIRIKDRNQQKSQTENSWDWWDSD